MDPMGSKIVASNFSFLQAEWPALYAEATKAEHDMRSLKVAEPRPCLALRAYNAKLLRGVHLHVQEG
jgi:hypothetical protein